MISCQAIVSILKEQIEGYKALFALLQRERECLIHIDTEKIEEISKEKDTTVMRLRLLEEERIRLTRKVAEDNGITRDISLQELEMLTGDNTFSALRSKLLSLLQSIEEMNKFNGILIDRSLKYIKINTNFFSSFMTDLNPKNKGIIVSKET